MSSFFANEIEEIVNGLCSDKLQVRNKANQRMNNMLTNNLDHLCTFAKSCENSDNPFDRFFESANRGIMLHARKLYNNNETLSESHGRYISNGLELLTNEANVFGNINNILSSLRDSMLQEAVQETVSSLYISALKNILLRNCETKFSSVMKTVWQDLLIVLLKILEAGTDTSEHRFCLVTDCISKIVEFGCRYSNMVFDLVKLKALSTIKKLLKITDGRPVEKERLLVILYDCCKHLIADFRFELVKCLFTESLFGDIRYVFEKNMKSARKPILFKLMDIAIIVHVPNLNETDSKKLQFIPNIDVWKKMLRTYEWILDKELQQKYTIKRREKRVPDIEISLITALSIARFCYHYYWSDELRSNIEDNQHQQTVAKRQKRSSKLQVLFEKIKPNENSMEKFNWNWLMVFSELVYYFPNSLTTNDVHDVLSMLAECQSHIEIKEQQFMFTKCCFVLLQRDESFRKSGNKIIYNQCEKLWMKIVEESARVCTSSCDNSIEAHGLLQLLIYFKKCHEESSIKRVVHYFTSNSVTKCDYTLMTLIVLLQSFNLDLLEKGSDLAIDILKFVFEKATFGLLKKFRTISDEKPSHKIVAKLAVMCCLLKTDMIKYLKNAQINERDILKKILDTTEQEEYNAHMEQAIYMIQLKGYDKLIIEQKVLANENHVENKRLSIPLELECIIDQNLYVELMKLTEFSIKAISEESSIKEIKDYVKDILESNELMLNLASEFLMFEAFNREKYETSYIIKKIDYNLQEINRLFSLLVGKSDRLDANDKFAIVTVLNGMFENNLHAEIGCKIRNHDLTHCFNWLFEQANYKHVNYNENRKAMKVDEESFKNAQKDERIRYLCILALCKYFNYEGVNQNELTTAISDKIQFDEQNSNMDVHAILKITEIFGNQKKISLALVTWIWSSIVEIYEHHFQSNYIMEQLIERFDSILEISKDYITLTNDVIVIFKAFSNLCVESATDVNRVLNAKLATKFISKFESFHKMYFKHFDDHRVQDMYKNLVVSFMISESIDVRMATIRCLMTVLHSDIEIHYSPNDNNQMIKGRQKINRVLFKKLPKINKESNDDFTNDLNLNTVSFLIQVHSAMICSDFNNRLLHAITFAKTFSDFEILKEFGQEMMRKIRMNLKCDRLHSIISDVDLVGLMREWIESSSLISFPWYLTESGTMEKFASDSYNIILLAFIKSEIQYLDEVIRGLATTPKNALKPIMANCWAFIIPYEANCRVDYGETAQIAKDKILTIMNSTEMQSFVKTDISKIIVNILENVVDNPKFQDICGLNPDCAKTSESITLNDFAVCLDFMKKYFPVTSNDSLVTHLCKKDLHSIEQTFLLLKKEIQGTEMKERKVLGIIRYNIFLSEIYAYMKNPNIPSENSIKSFLIRDITFFLCHLIANDKNGQRLRQIAGQFFLDFLKVILPVCITDAKHQLPRIISQLVQVCTALDKKSQELRPKCLEIIEFLVLNQSCEMNEEIAKLDRFPEDNDFKRVRAKQIQVKYANGEYTLRQEIEHFLDRKKSTLQVEGLIALREHISNNRRELKQLFEQVRNAEYNKEDTLLHKLIRSLIFYANAFLSDKRTVEAVKCLGEIGVHSIETMVFNNEMEPETYEKIGSVEECQKIICHKSLERIEKILLNPNAVIFPRASEACYNLLKSASSQDYQPTCYLRPFIPAINASELNIFYLEPKPEKRLQLKKLVIEKEFEIYSIFIKHFLLEMTNFSGDRVLGNLAANQTRFAEMLLPLVFQLLLHYNNPTVIKEILDTLNFFFEKSYEKLNYNEQTTRGSIFVDKKILRQMLKLVEITRFHCQDHQKSCINKMLKLNYLHVAKSAKHCGAFFSAIQYCELWAQTRLDIDEIEFSISIKNSTLEEIMFHAYSAIGIKEACDLYVNSNVNRSLYLQTRGLNYQALLEMSDQTSMMEYFTLLNSCGLQNLAYNADKSMKEVNESKQYECLWQLCKWDKIVDIETEIKDDKGLIDYKAEFEKYHYLSLKSCKNDDELGLKKSIDKGRKAIIMLISQQSFECSRTLYEFLEMSHRLAQIEDFCEVRFKRVQNSHEKLLEKWKFHDKLPFDYEHYNRILLQRNSIFDTANIKSGRRTWVPEAHQANLLFIAKQSIISGYPNDAVKAIAKIKNLENVSHIEQLECLLEEAKLNAKKIPDLAKECLGRIIENKQIESNYILKSKAYHLYGEILAENYTFEISDITKNYFDQSTAHIEKYARIHGKDHLVSKLDDKNPDQLSQGSDILLDEENDDDIELKIREASGVYDTIAKYHDRDYQFKRNYLTSEDFLKKKESYKKNVERYEAMKLSMNKDTTSDVKKSYVVLQKSINMDKEEIDDAEKRKKSAARNALYYYVRSTINSMDDNIFNIYRIVSLMLENFHSIVFVQKLLIGNLLRIPSYKFLTALPQLVVRLGSDQTDKLNRLLKKLLEYCAMDHPHHTLPFILALKYSYKDSENKGPKEPRVTGAKELWEHLRKDKKLLPIMQEMEKMSLALIDLANVSTKSGTIPSEHAVLKLKRFQYTQCPTIELPIIKNGDYSGIVTTIVKWDQKITLVGGINAPKKIDVLCSDGVRRPQLLKGKDDMRQDAIMMQIFNVVNKFFQLDKEMHKKNARIRTYKIVPFSRRSGILEWCSNTMPFGVYLTGERHNNKLIKLGAHQIYRPNDWTPDACIKKISDAALSNNSVKLQVYNEVCKHIKPVFHHFFDERYKSSSTHFERRYAYTVSVAVSSMIGYILGIGDRHVQNILIDLMTAELINIDFGVAFEQGKCLPHPELIPFRLTRDMVAPMGVSGVNGIFKKSCEQTLEILRQNERTITTILEVLLYDPMYTWSVGAEVARRCQLDSEESDDSDLAFKEEHNSMATRALQRVQSKLKGMTETMTDAYPSVEGHVQYLIQAATNTENLSRLFRGWQAYL